MCITAQSFIITHFHHFLSTHTHTHMQVYQLQVKREDLSAPPSTLFRRYREFDEMHSKLLQCFPNDLLPPLPGKIFIPGKSHTRQVPTAWGLVYMCHHCHNTLTQTHTHTHCDTQTSEKRQIELNTYLAALLDMETSISEVCVWCVLNLKCGGFCVKETSQYLVMQCCLSPSLVRHCVHFPPLSAAGPTRPG